MEKGMMSVNDFETYFGIGRKKAYELVNSKGFPAFRVGRKILISRDGLEKWIKDQQDRKDEI